MIDNLYMFMFKYIMCVIMNNSKINNSNMKLNRCVNEISIIEKLWMLICIIHYNL